FPEGQKMLIDFSSWKSAINILATHKPSNAKIQPLMSGRGVNFAERSKQTCPTEMSVRAAEFRFLALFQRAVCSRARGTSLALWTMLKAPDTGLPSRRPLNHSGAAGGCGHITYGLITMKTPGNARGARAGLQ